MPSEIHDQCLACMAVELPEDRAVHPLRERMDAIAQPRMASELEVAWSIGSQM